MVVDDDEQYFPRGGTPGRIKQKKTYVFDENKKTKEPKKKLGKRERMKLKREKFDRTDKDEEQDSEEDPYVNELPVSDEGPAEITIRKVEPLGYQNLAEGLVTLCSVSSIQPRTIKLTLPERLLCTVGLRNISTPLVEEATKSGSKNKPTPVHLKTILRVGDLLACKIKSVKKTGTNYEVHGTTDPADVNSNLKFSEIHKGFTFLGAVKSVEDHGYIIFSGINCLTAFLPFANSASYIALRKEKKRFPIGKLLWCKVVKSTLGETVNNVQVSVNFENFGALSDDISAHMIHPGMDLSLTVTKHLGRDLEVNVDGTDVVSVIPHSQFRKFGEDVKRYNIGSSLRGTVMYKYPISNASACSLRVKVASLTDDVLDTGEIVERAEIVCHDKRGLGVKFEHKGTTCYGVVSKRRMEGNVAADRLDELFPRGNHLTVVIIGYHHVDQLYTCSTQNELLSGKLLPMRQLKEMVGKVVTVIVQSVNERGAVVKLENRTAFVPISEITDTQTTNPLKKLQVNSKQKGRILQINADKNSVIITLRPTLVNQKPLTDFTKAIKGDAYYGSISFIGDNKIFVTFFNALKVHISQENLIQEAQKYSVGQLVKCYVIKETRNNQPAKFSLVRHVDQMELSIGLTYKLIVKGKTDSGIACLLEERNNIWNVDIPLRHLSDHKSLQKKRLDAFTLGTTVDGHLFCFDSSLNPVFTLRRSVKQFFAEGGQNLIANGCTALKPKSIIPVILAEEIEGGFYVSVPVPKFNGKVIVSKEVVQRYRNVSEGDLMYLSVERVNFESRRINLEFVSVETHYKSLKQWAISYLESYIEEMSQFQTYKAGAKVSAVATEAKNQCQLPDGRTGLIYQERTAKKAQPGSYLKLMVLHDNGSQVSLCEAASIPEECLGTKKMGSIFSNEMYFVCKSAVGAVFCPRYFRPNSIQPDVQSSYVNSKKSLAIEVSTRNGEMLFGTVLAKVVRNRTTSMLSSDVEDTVASPCEKPKKRSRSLSAVPVVHKKQPKTTLVKAGIPDEVSPTNTKTQVKKSKRRTDGNHAKPGEMKVNPKRPRKMSL